MDAPRNTPNSTYRLQLTADFTFNDAVVQLPCLKDLGITHLFCSPILQAAPGSTHGYDVVDHTRISQELGGEEGFRHLAKVAHEQGIGPGPQVGKAYKFLSGATHRARPDPSGRGEAAAAELVA